MSTKIDHISLVRMTNGAHYSYMQTTIERIEADETVKTKIATELATLKSAFLVEDENLKTSQKNTLSDQIALSDTQRDGFYTGYKSAVNGFMKLPDGDLLAYAKKLWQHIMDYKIDTKWQLDRQTGMMTNFIADLESKFATEVEALGLTTFVTNMKEANDEVRELLKERDTANATKTVGATKASRQATDDAYRAAIDKVNAYILVEGPTDYQSFIDGMNAQITRYKREVLGQTSSPTTPIPEDPDSSTPEDPDQGGESGTPEGV